jgi:monosaccharide-transporting ATPase
MDSPGNAADLLSLTGIVKTFPGVRALDSVDFTLRRGEIHALMGENGAGKSTLIKVLTGVYRRDAGDMRLLGQSIDPHSPLEAERLGIATVYQEVNLLREQSVAENLAIGREPTRLGMIRWRQVRRDAEAALARVGLRIDVSAPLRSYSLAIQQMVAIARALQVDAKVLVLDEPTSSLDAAEVEALFGVMRSLRDEGMGIVFVSHFLDQVYAVSDRLTVLRNGKLVGAYEAATLPRLELIAKMIGKDIAEVEAMTARHGAEPVQGDHQVLVSAQGMGRRNAVEAVDLEIRAGEVVGLAGLLGSGRTETAQLLFGIDSADHGEIRLDGEAVRAMSPRRAIGAGLAFTPEDRKHQGIIPGLSVRENIVLALQARRGWMRKIGRRQQDALATRFIDALKIATPNAEKPVDQLSGGNQQKVLLGRWLAMDPRVFILDEPTRGIDVGAKAEIERLIAQLCADGMAVVFISSELDEVVRDCHRVLVLRDRKQVAMLEGEAVNLETILRHIAASPEEVDA